MIFNSKNRQSTRWKGYDYSREGAYFLTICSKDKEPCFGEMQNGILCISDIGEIIHKEWHRTVQLRKNISLGEFVIMPDHFHAILFIDYQLSSDEGKDVKEYENTFGKQSNNISAIVRGFKSSCTKQIIEKGFSEFSWQSGFHDRVVRNYEELIKIENYILSNPGNWVNDMYM